MDYDSGLLNETFEKLEFEKSAPIPVVGEQPDCSGAVTDSEGSNEEDDKLVEVQIGPQHFDLLKLVGEGAFGKVLLVRNRLNKQLCAMKVISKKLLKKKNNIAYMKSERDILTNVAHPFIVTLFFAFQSHSKVFLVMDFLSGGELFYHLRRRGLILEKEVQFYLAEMIVAIDFLHCKGAVLFCVVGLRFGTPVQKNMTIMICVLML